MAELTHLLENLDSLESNLLALERLLKEDGDATSYVHLIFQNAHNLKSGLAFSDFSHSASLIHALEDEFDGVRRGKHQVKGSLIDFCMRAIDAIRSSIEAGAEAVSALEGLLDEAQRLVLEQATPGATVQVAANEVLVTRFGMKMTEAEALRCDDLLNAGHDIYRVDKLLKRNLTRAQWDNLPIRDDLAVVGQLVLVQPNFETFQAGMDEQAVKFLLATTWDEERLKREIYDPLILQQKAIKIASPAAATSLKLLIAEDDLFSAKLLSTLLRPFGQPTVALDGKRAWEEIQKAYSAGEPFHFILLDIMMPHKTGREILADLRELEESLGVRGLDRAKVVINSSLGDMDNVQGAFRDQADGYLVKPFTLEKITAHLEKLKLIKPIKSGG